MAISFSSIDLTYNLPHARNIESWISDIIENKRFRVGDIHCNFCSDKYIIEANNKFLSHNYTTDIITFDYSTHRKISGDILISIPTVTQNAERFEVSFFNELLRVIIHGVLHLMGYKDGHDSEKEEMRKAEDLSLLLYETNFH